LDLAIRSFYNASTLITAKTHRKRQCEFTALGLVEKTRGKPSLDRVQFQFRL
jgi:hypothetical protein